jgi:hypothetical protein
MLDFNANGEVPEKHCCDVCEENASAELREAPSVLEFFRRNKRRFTQDKAASVLAASETIRWSQEEANQVINCLLKAGKLKRMKLFPWKDRLTMGC